MSISQIIGAAWESIMREAPDTTFYLWDDVLHPGRTTYRQRLDRIQINNFGDVIPRITIVRNNLRKLGKPTPTPRLPD